MSYNGVLFLHETHSSSKDEIKWKDEFKGELFFSHGKSNSCGVAVGYTEKEKWWLFNNRGYHFLIIEAMIDDCAFILINLYNSNTEKEQVSTWEKLNLMPQTFDDLENKITVLGGDLTYF